MTNSIVHHAQLIDFLIYIFFVFSLSSCSCFVLHLSFFLPISKLVFFLHLSFILFPVDSLTTLLTDNRVYEPSFNSSIALDAFDLLKYVLYLLVHYLICFVFFVSTNATTNNSSRHQGNVTFSANGQTSTTTREVIIESASTAGNQDITHNNSAHSYHNHHQSPLTNQKLSSLSNTASVLSSQSSPPVIEYFVSFLRSAHQSVRHIKSASTATLVTPYNNFTRNFGFCFSSILTYSKMVEIYKHQPNGGGMPTNNNGQQDGYMEPEEEWEREGLLDPAWEKQQRKVSPLLIFLLF